MENASKALIIAGAVLIGILIIIVLSFYSLYTVINSHSYLPYHSILS